MAYAYFTAHQPDALFPIQNRGESSAMYCCAFLLLVFTGPGAFALDRLLPARGNRGARTDQRPQAAAVRPRGRWPRT